MSERRAVGDDTLLPGLQEVTSEKRKLSADELPRGASIGRYLIVEKLGSGGMGVVYAAYDPDLNRKVAIKLLRSQPGAMASQGRARLLREAQAMARLSHPNVVAVFDVGVAFDQVFVAMEFVEGTTLGEWLNQERTTDEILQVFAEAGQGLAAAHAAGIVHRDFKPDNVMIGRDGRARVMDFGVARDVGQPISDPGPVLVPTRSAVALDQTLPDQSSRGLAAMAVSSPLTQEGALMGTPRYMSPEQFRGQASDARSDQFSYCIALYEAICGRPPFAGDNLGELAMQVFLGQVRSFPPEKKVPTWLRRALLRGLKVQPSERYPSLQDLLEDLSPERRRRRRRVLILLSSFAAMVIAGLVSVGVYRGNQELKAQRCQTVDEQLAPVFGIAAKTAAREGLAKTKKAYADDVWRRVENNLSHYLTSWQAMRRDTCQATFVAGKQTAELHSRRLRCLDARLQEVAAFMNLLRTADEQVLDSAVDQSSDLSLLAPCADPHFLQQLAQEKPVERERLDILSRQLSEARLLHNAGRVQTAKERAHKVLSAAQQLDNLPLQARAERELSMLETSGGDPFAGHQRAMSAAALGVRGGDFLTAAWAFTDLMYLAQVTQRGISVDKWQQFAEATLARVEGSSQVKARIQATLDLYLCQHLSAQRQKVKADEQCLLALRENERVFGPESSQMGTVLNSLAMHNRRQDRYPEAESLYRRALTVSEAHQGSEHPRLVTIHENLGVLLELMGKSEAAESEYQRALQVAERAFGAEHPKLYGTLKQLVLLKLRQNQAAEAIPLAERAAALYKGTPRAVSGKLLLASVLQKTGRFADALVLHEEALSQCSGKTCTDLPMRLLGMADDLHGLARDKQALPLLEQAHRQLPPLPSPPQLLSQSELETRARIEQSLAEVLWAIDGAKSSARVIDLGNHALKLFADLGRMHRSDSEELRGWLQARKLLQAEHPAAMDTKSAASP